MIGRGMRIVCSTLLITKSAVCANVVIASFQQGDRTGTYWGIRTNIADYHLASALDCPHKRTLALAHMPTRLKRLSKEAGEAHQLGLCGV